MKFIPYFFSLLLVLAGGCTRPSEQSPQSVTPELGEALPGMLRIKLNPASRKTMNARSDADRIETGIADLDRIARELGATRIERSFADGGEHEWKAREAGLDLWYDLYFDELVPVSRAYDDISALDEIDVVEPDYKIGVVGTPRVLPRDRGYSPLSATTRADYPVNDPLIRYQWNLNNLAQLPGMVQGADVNAFTAWRVTAGIPEVIVCVVDGGIDFSHEDLADNMWQNARGEYGYNFVDGNAVIEPHEHGTHVAGIIAAVGNNGTGVAGIAGGTGRGDGVKLMSSQIYKYNPADPEHDISSSRVHEAIRFGADNGAVISQNSWGYLWEDQTRPPSGLLTIHKDAIDYFIRNAGTDGNGNQTGPMKGGIVIFAAGNDDTEQKIYPGAYEKVISVAGMSPNYKRAWYSNYGSWIDMTAPGGNSLMGSAEYAVLSTLPDNDYWYMQGTSMACPHVSAVAALVVSNVGGDGFTPDELKSILLGATRNIDKYQNQPYVGKMGAGYIDAAMAVMPDSGLPPEKVEDLNASWKTGRVELAWSVTADGNGFRTYEYDIYISKTPLSSVGDLVGLTPSKTVVTGSKDVGDVINETVVGLQEQTRYYVAVRGVDMFGNMSEPAFTSGATLVNHAPELTSAFPTMYFNETGSTQMIIPSNYFTDPDGDDLTYLFSTDTFNTMELETVGTSVKITAKFYGITKVTITATDPLGETASGTFTIFSRDGSQAVEVFPNPVEDIINFRVGMGEHSTVDVTIYSNTGAKVLESAVPVRPYIASPLDLSGLKPGNYSLVTKLGNSEVKRTIVKL